MTQFYVHLPVGGENDVTLEDVLGFFTGANAIPPLCFPVKASLHFNDQNPYPTASICSLFFTLPTKYTAYTEFN